MPPSTLASTGPDVADFIHVSRPTIARYLALKAQAEEDADAARAAADRVADAKRDAIAAEREVMDLERADQRGEMVRNIHAPGENTVIIRDVRRLEATEQRRDNFTEVLHVAIARHKALVAKAEASGRLLARAGSYLSGTIGTELNVAPDIPLPLEDGEDLMAASTRTRAKLADLVEQRRAVKHGPGTIAEAKAAMRRAVDKLRQAPDVATLFAPEPFMRWPTWRLPEGLGIGSGYLPSKVDGAALLAFLFPDQLVAALDREIEAHAPTDAMTQDRREQRLAEIDGEILWLGYDEQTLVDASGSVLQPRPNADVRCVLWIASNSPPPKGTS